MTIRPGTRLVIVLAIALAQTACSGPKPPPPTVAELTLAAAPGLNPAPPDNRPSPVVVRLYELGAADGFLNADFHQLAGDAASVLGKDLVAQDQFTVVPDSSRTLVRQVDPQTRFIGLIVAYRSLDQADWRALAPLPANLTTRLQARLDSLAVTLTPIATGS
jgi:type VI secretion system protein VasD